MSSGRPKLAPMILGFLALVLLGADSKGCTPGPRVGSDTCLACHDGRTASDKTEFNVGLHATIACEDCHGSGAAHARNVGRGSRFIGNPARLPIPESTDTCVECHAEATQGYLVTTHASAGVSCHDCHDVHREGAMLFRSPNRAFLSHEEYGLTCAECHSTAVDDYALSRHFDLPELTCAVCHDMHVETMFTANPRTNRLCLQCHQSRTLGFTSDEIVDEHTGFFHPVDPAGSGASRCTKCHLPPIFADGGGEGVNSHTLDPVAPSITNESVRAGDDMILANSCAGVMGCHDPDVPGSGQPHDVFDLGQNTALQGVFELIGQVP